jgi:hypothetical protein
MTTDGMLRPTAEILLLPYMQRVGYSQAPFAGRTREVPEGPMIIARHFSGGCGNGRSACRRHA